MKVQKIFLTLIIFLILSIMVSAVTSIYSEDFEYIDPYSNHGWTLQRCNINVLDSPVPTINGTGTSFGYNGSTAPCSGFQRIWRDLSANITNGEAQISYSVMYIEDTDSGSDFFKLLIGNHSSDFTGARIDFSHSIGTTEAVGSNSPANFVSCTHEYNFLPSQRVDAFILIDFDTRKYTWSIDGNTTGCDNVDFGDTTLGTVEFYTQLNINENVSTNIDDFLIEITDVDLNVTVKPVNSPCEGSDECETGKCERGTCIYKGFSEDCFSSSECLSGSCLSGQCTKPSLWDSVDASKDELGGDDANSETFIAIFFMVLVPLAIIFYGKSIPAVMGGILIHFVIGGFFAVVGWLPAFILFIEFVIAIIMFVFMLMVGGGHK